MTKDKKQKNNILTISTKVVFYTWFFSNVYRF